VNAHQRRITVDGLAIIVTGASSGLGAHTARYLAREGANVIAAARRSERLKRLAVELREAAGTVVPVTADVTQPSDAEAVVSAAIDAFGRVDVLVNNAASEVQGPIDSLSESDLEAMLRVNVISVFLCTRAVLPALRESRGAVINIGSTVVTRPPRGRFGYVAAKGAVEAMSRALAADLGPSGIRVNVIRPGLIPSELRGSTEDEERSRFGGDVFRTQALATIGHGSDVAAAVAYLSSEAARWVTGAILDVDGGWTLGLSD
jgi:NAD(P)-dependent dehydrogenase (short-subunit alcohol dehydrogenase family)